MYRNRLQAVLRPIVEALVRGESVLVHCLNGRHRSTQACCLLLCCFLGDVDKAWNLIWKLRSLAEFTSKRGVGAALDSKLRRSIPNC